jgi:hypothetical protein
MCNCASVLDGCALYPMAIDNILTFLAEFWGFTILLQGFFQRSCFYCLDQMLVNGNCPLPSTYGHEP